MDEPEGLESPTERLYENNGKVLGNGVGVSPFTAIHLAEWIANLEYLSLNKPGVLFKRQNQKNIF
ncbi:MAG: AAC(3) family N-acetyltransferase [Pseudomonadales bacterium]|nr:AAC(3) family N-acetyltransferase [Pseudomonadales bacterium]